MNLLKYLCSEILAVLKIYSGKVILTLLYAFIIIGNWNPANKQSTIDNTNAMMPMYLIGTLITINLYFLFFANKINKYMCLNFIKKPSNAFYSYLINPVNKELEDNLSSFIIVTISILVINMTSLWHMRASEMQNIYMFKLMSKDMLMQSVEIILMICGISAVNTMIYRNIEIKLT